MRGKEARADLEVGDEEEPCCDELTVLCRRCSTHGPQCMEALDDPTQRSAPCLTRCLQLLWRHTWVLSPGRTPLHPRRCSRGCSGQRARTCRTIFACRGRSGGRIAPSLSGGLDVALVFRRRRLGPLRWMLLLLRATGCPPSYRTVCCTSRRAVIPSTASRSLCSWRWRHHCPPSGERAPVPTFASLFSELSISTRPV
jgi:hypothetical protein